MSDAMAAGTDLERVPETVVLVGEIDSTMSYLMLAARHEDLMLPLPRDARALRLAERWSQMPGETRDLADMAVDVGASLRTLQRLFPSETGLTLEAWRQKARLIHAVGRLAAGASVTNTALDCGYQRPAAFSSAFLRQFGVSPGRYRVQ